MNKKLSTLLVILGGAGWGCISLFINPLSSIGMTSMEISAIRMLVAAPFFVIIALFKDKSLFKIKLKDIWMFIVLGLLAGVTFNILYMYTIIHSEASVAVMLLYTSPIFVMIESYFLFKDKLTKTKFISLIMTVAGCVLVAGFIGSGTSIPALVLLTGVLTGLSYGTFTVMTRLATTKYNPLTVTVYTFVLGAAMMAPLGNLKEGIAILSNHTSYIPLALGIGVVCSVLANTCFTYGISNVESSAAAILAASEPLVATLIGIFVFNDSHGILKILGIIIVLAAIVIQGFDNSKS